MQGRGWGKIKDKQRNKNKSEIDGILSLIISLLACLVVLFFIALR